MRYIAPYAATSIGEYFMEQGRDVLIVYDDLTNHANTYREISLLLRRPPGREAFPGDIFYIHSRLLERATRLRKERGEGSLTALPIIQTEAHSISGHAFNILPGFFHFPGHGDFHRAAPRHITAFHRGLDAGGSILGDTFPFADNLLGGRPD